MLRSMVGWYRVEGDAWSDIHSRKESLANRPPKGWDEDLTCFECAFFETLGMMPLIR